MVQRTYRALFAVCLLSMLTLLSVAPTYAQTVQDVLPALSVGTPVTVDLTGDQPTAFFSFENDQRSTVFRLTGTVIKGEGQVYLEVRNSSDEAIGQLQQTASTATLEPLFITGQGSYVISVSLPDDLESPDTPPAPLQVSVVLEPVEAKVISLGETVRAELTDANPSDYYTVAAKEGDWLRLSNPALPTGAQAFEAVFFAPDGTYLSGITVADSYNTPGQVLDPLRIPDTGTYLLAVRRVDMRGTGELEPADYALTLDESPALLLHEGVAVEAAVGGTVPENRYRYEGTAGETIRLSLQSLSHFAPGIWFEGPPPSTAGAANAVTPFQFTVMGNAAGKVTYEITLPVTGAYFLRVSNSFEATRGPTAGAYRLSIEVMHNG